MEQKFRGMEERTKGTNVYLSKVLLKENRENGEGFIILRDYGWKFF